MRDQEDGVAKRAWSDDDDETRNNGLLTGSSDHSTLGDVRAYQGLEPVAKRSWPLTPVIVVAVLSLIATIAGVVMLSRMGVLPPWLLTLVISVDLILLVGTVALFWLWRNPRQARFWVVMVVAVALIVSNAVVVKVGIDYLRFGQMIQTPATDTILYDIVVRDDGPTEVSQLAASLMGEDRDDRYIQAVHEAISDMVKVYYWPVTPWTQMITDLLDESVESIVINDGLMQILAEADPTSYEQLRILTSFEIPDSLATPDTPTPTATVDSEAYVIYISGIDSYGPISTRARSDVNILMVINPTTGKILLVNTPRDYYVDLRGKTGLKDKLTHAGVYGINVSVGTIEDLYDVKVDYYLRINFSSLITVVDAVGGVDVNSEYAFSAGGYQFVKGKNHLDGKAALAFSRERKSFSTGDRARGENQQRVIEGIIQRLTDPMVLMGYSQVLDAVGSSLQTSMPLDLMSSLVQRQLQTSQSWNVESISVNGADSSQFTYSYPGQRLYVMEPDLETVRVAKESIQAAIDG